MKIETNNLGAFNLDVTKFAVVVIVMIAYMKILGLIVMSLVGFGAIVTMLAKDNKISVRIR